MKSLETEFKRHGLDYRQIWRQKDVAVFEYGTAPRYELVIIHVQPEHTDPTGKIVLEREAYPANSQWGQYGWTLGPKDRELAIHIAEQIVNLPAVRRIPKIHEIMDHWIETRRALKSVKPLATAGISTVFAVPCGRLDVQTAAAGV